MSAFVCAADSWHRTRACPCGTTGKPKPVTNTPSSSSISLIWIARAVSPTMIGTIGVSPASGAKPASVICSRKYVVFWDNNLGADRPYFRELCEALIPLKRVWGTETSIDTITPDSARLMGRSGCRFLYIGLESLAQELTRIPNSVPSAR